MPLWRTSILLCLFVLLAAVSVQATEWEMGSGTLGQLFGPSYHPLNTLQHPYIAHSCSDLWHRQHFIPESPCLSSMHKMACAQVTRGCTRAMHNISPLGRASLHILYSPIHQEVSRARKSTKVAFFLSLLLPGAGQYYAQAPQKAKLFLSAESALWALFLGFRTYGSWHEADYSSFAIEHAVENPTGQSDEYLDDLGFYASAFEYNRYARRESGPQATLYSGNKTWEWDSEASRLKYRTLRKNSLLARSRAMYVFGGLLLHRMVSAIHAVRLAHVWNEGITKQGKHVQLYFVGLPEHEPTLRLTLFRNF